MSLRSASLSPRLPLYLVLIAPAGGGKTTLSEALIEQEGDSLKRVVTATSRGPRPGEVPGESYHFLGVEGFRKSIENEEFFEWEETHGNLYGTPRRSLEQTGTPSDLLMAIDIRGSRAVKKAFPKQTVSVFIVPPAPKVLRERLMKRGATESDVAVRLETARKEYRWFLEDPSHIDYFLINDKFDTTLEALRGIVASERLRIKRYSMEYLQSLCVVE